MSTPFICELLTRMDVRPAPLFQGDVESNDSDVGEEVNALVAEETMPTQAPEALGEVGNLSQSIGLLDLEGYVDIREPWIEGSMGEKVCCSELRFRRSLMSCSVFSYRWLIT
jgi:hypothetical protein